MYVVYLCGGPETSAGRRHPALSGTAVRRRRRAEFGELNLHAQADLGQDRIEGAIARFLAQIVHRSLKSREGRGIQRSGEQAELELVESIEGEPAALDGAPSPLGRIFQALQRNQGIDAADGAERSRAGGAGLIRLVEGERA